MRTFPAQRHETSCGLRQPLNGLHVVMFHLIMCHRRHVSSTEFKTWASVGDLLLLISSNDVHWYSNISHSTAYSSVWKQRRRQWRAYLPTRRLSTKLMKASRIQELALYNVRLSNIMSRITTSLLLLFLYSLSVVSYATQCPETRLCWESREWP